MYKGKLHIASDHGGYHLKKRLIRFIENELSLKVEDMGPQEYKEEDDYPDYAIPLAQKVASEKSRGIVICKNGEGVCMASNKIDGIRAGIGYNLMAAESMMADDNTNVLCLAAKALSEDHAMAVTKKWLETEFSEEERHVRRLKKVEELEK
jgi:ribose 5-phosphate isomerase B